MTLAVTVKEGRGENGGNGSVGGVDRGDGDGDGGGGGGGAPSAIYVSNNLATDLL